MKSVNKLIGDEHVELAVVPQPDLECIIKRQAKLGLPSTTACRSGDNLANHWNGGRRDTYRTKRCDAKLDVGVAAAG